MCVLCVSFEKTQVMQKSLKKAFEEFINKDNRVSKLLAKFVNDVLKKGSKVNVRDVESTLDNVVFLYGYISEKDVFERGQDTEQRASERASETLWRRSPALGFSVQSSSRAFFPFSFPLCLFSRLPDLPQQPSADGPVRERAQ